MLARFQVQLRHPQRQLCRRTTRPHPGEHLLITTRQIVDTVVAERPHETSRCANLLDAAAVGATLRAGGLRRCRRWRWWRRRGLDLDDALLCWDTRAARSSAGGLREEMQRQATRRIESALLIAVHSKVRSVWCLLSDCARHGELPLTLSVAVALRARRLVGGPSSPGHRVAACCLDRTRIAGGVEGLDCH